MSRHRTPHGTTATVVAILLSACAGAGRSGGPLEDSPEVRVTVLTSPGCSQTDAAIEQVERVAARLGIATSVERVVVETAEEATRRRLLGSPTFLVEGRDLDPAARDRTDFALT